MSKFLFGLFCSICLSFVTLANVGATEDVGSQATPGSEKPVVSSPENGKKLVGTTKRLNVKERDELKDACNIQ